MTHKISIEANCRSNAKLLFHGKMPDRFIEGQSYEIEFKLKNEGKEDFPEGRAEIQIVHTTQQVHFIRFPIKEIKRGDDILVSSKNFTRSAMSRGYALFFCQIFDKDNKPVQLITYGQKLPGRPSFHAVFIESRTDIYTYDALRISAIGLIISALSLAALAASSILQFLSK